MLRTCNNTDGNKLVIFSSIALYYGGTYIVSVQTVFPCERMRSGHKANATTFHKPVIFSSIALYYGGTYIVSAQTVFPCERMRSGHKANATSPFTNS